VIFFVPEISCKSGPLWHNLLFPLRERSGGVFFNRNKWWMIILSFAVLIGGFVVLQSKMKEEQRRGEAAKQFASAQTPEELKKIVQDYPKTEAALSAQLTLGDRYYQEAQYSDAKNVYLEILKQPTSAVSPMAKYGLGAIEETQGRAEEALQIYRSIPQDFEHSPQAPLALYSAARILERQGKLEDAYQTYEKLSAQFSKSSWTRQAEQRLKSLSLQLKPTAAHPPSPNLLPPLTTPPSAPPTPPPSTPKSTQ
jgi:tetratricopeptide (TPR) repeat protein